MSSNKGIKNEILELRKMGKTYDEISKKLNCSKSTISYHCQKNNLNDIGLGGNKLTNENISIMKDFYSNHSLSETAKKFEVSKTTVTKYVNKKRIKLTIEEKKKIRYERLKTRRQKMKIKAVDYKGGKCIKCNYNSCICALEFHHRDPSQKDFIFSKYSNHSWERIKKEIDKCDLVCSNCHREIHYKLFSE